jgi:DNA-binding transcriptional ArsR family regulator
MIDEVLASDPTLAAAPEPAAVRVIDSAEAIKAIADPLRLRLLQLLMTTSDRAWSVKEIAAEIGQTVTKLYHHIKILESAGLIADVETRMVSGIVEHRYRASQKALRFDDSLFGAPETRSDAIAQMAAIVDVSRDDLLGYLGRSDADIDLVNVSKATARLTAEQIATVNATIEDLIASFALTREANESAGIPRTSMLFIVHPMAHDPSTPDRM